MTKVVWLPNETDYLYCEFVAPNTLYSSYKASTNHQASRFSRLVSSGTFPAKGLAGGEGWGHGGTAKLNYNLLVFLSFDL